MAEFDTSHVKNIVLLGHAGSGKTTLAECMLFEAGLTTRRGKIEEHNTTGDYHELEQERGNSIFYIEEEQGTFCLAHQNRSPF